MQIDLAPKPAEVLRLLQRHPNGIRLVDIMVTTGDTHCSCSLSLRTLRAAGLAEPTVMCGSGAAWATIENVIRLRAEAAAVRESLLRQKAERKAERQRKKDAAEDKAREEAAEEREVALFARPSIHRHLSQAEWVGRPVSGVPGSRPRRSR